MEFKLVSLCWLCQQGNQPRMYEVYLVAKGKSIAVVNDEDLALEAGDVLVIEPGEVHTFVDSSADYLHFVINTPVVPDDKHIVE